MRGISINPRIKRDSGARVALCGSAWRPLGAPPLAGGEGARPPQQPRYAATYTDFTRALYPQRCMTRGAAGLERALPV